PRLLGLTPETRAKLQAMAVEGIRKVSNESGGLSILESSALALALAGIMNGDNPDRKLAATIEETLLEPVRKVDSVKHPKEAEQQAAKLEKVLKGIYKALPSTQDVGTPGSQSLARVYSKAAASENNRYYGRSGVGDSLKEQMNSFFKLAEQGNPEAILILTAIAGGAGKHNSKANPFVEIEKDGSKSQVPGDELAQKATEVLVSVARNDPEAGARILETLLKECQDGESKETAARLQTLAMVAAIEPLDMPDAVRNRLFASLHNDDTRANAIKCLLIIGNALSADDLKKLCENFEQRDIQQLYFCAHRLPVKAADQMCALLLTRVFDGTATEESRLTAIAALGALGSFHGDSTVIGALQLLGSKEAAGELALDLRLAPGADGKANYSAANRIQKEAAMALLRICEGSPREETQTAAFQTLTSGDWGPVFTDALKFNHDLIRNRLCALMRDNPESITFQQGVPKFLSGERAVGDDAYRRASAPARIGAGFRDLGAEQSDAVLLKLSQLALTRYSAGEIETLMDRLSLLNSLPPDLRKQLTAAAAPLKTGADFSLEGKMVSAETFNRLPAEVKFRIFGSTSPITPSATLSGDTLKGKIIPAEVFNTLEPSLRQALSGSTDELPVAERLDLRGLNVDPRVFNLLPEDVRKQLFGSAELMPEGQKVELKKSEVLDAVTFNSLPPAVRQAITGDSKLRPLTGQVHLWGKSLDAGLFNRLSDDQRKLLSGSSDKFVIRTLDTVPDLSRVFLNGKEVNALTEQQKKDLGLPSMKVPDGIILGLGDRSISAATFNGLPDSVKLAITGSTQPLAPDRVIKNLSLQSIDAATFNALPPDMRKLLTGSDRFVSPAKLLEQLAGMDASSGTKLIDALKGLPAPEVLFRDRFKVLQNKASAEESNLQ
ncbi:MAG: hypothetical protein K2Z81_28655, partial [Cyanobacteria bacterium]|nr:hypothetical protein [Cyanobacteriota bacterium]